MSIVKIPVERKHLAILDRVLRSEINFLNERRTDEHIEYPKADPEYRKILSGWNERLDAEIEELKLIRQLIQQEIKP